MAIQTSAVRNPFTGETIARIPIDDTESTERALARAHAAFEHTRHQPAHARADLLRRIASDLVQRKAELLDTIVAEAGKPISLAEAELHRAIWTFTSAAEEARRCSEGVPVSGDAYPSGTDHVALARRFPLGVVYGMTPFNFPLNLVAHKIAPAIACGNSIVIKPSPRTPLTALLLAQIISKAGAIAGQVNVINLPNERAADPIADARVRHVSFTGSTPVGWQVNEAAAKGKKRATLELGGNAGCIVHNDAPNLEEAIELIAKGGFGYAGQSCISVQRVFVHESIADEFTARLIDYVKQHIHCGDPRKRDVLVGPMIDDAAKQRILDAIGAARSAGAKIIHGGETVGSCVQPTIITDADPKLDVCAKEIFGPIVVIDRYKSFDDAIARVNESPFGLQAGAFTRDLNLAMRAFEELQVGGVMINQVPTARLENQPYGGSKDSGLGREGVRYAIEEMTELRALVIKTQ